MSGMSQGRKKAEGAIVVGATLALVVVALGGYVGAYFATSTYASDTQLAVRRFTYDWQAWLFSPALSIESRVRGLQIESVFPEPEWDESVRY